MKIFSAFFILLSMFNLCANQECNEVLQDVLKQVKTLEKSIKKLMYKRGMNESPGMYKKQVRTSIIQQFFPLSF